VKARFRSAAALLALTLSIGSCATLEALMATGLLKKPTVTFRGASLVRAPSQRDLSAFYCPRLGRERAGLGVAADLVCSRLFGAGPRPEDLALAFDLQFGVGNPNQIPLPLSDILTAITLFPGSGAQNLGAVCFRLCDPGDAACRGGQDPNACRQAQGDIRTMADFPGAVANMLVAEGLAAAGGQPVQFSAPRVLAGSNLDVVARFTITPQALLPIFEQLARQSVSQLTAGHELTFSIPYRLEGTVFANAGSLGRVAAGFGPSGGEWALPVQRLVGR
jgi:hypothetical protein